MLFDILRQLLFFGIQLIKAFTMDGSSGDQVRERDKISDLIKNDLRNGNPQNGSNRQEKRDIREPEKKPKKQRCNKTGEKSPWNET